MKYYSFKTSKAIKNDYCLFLCLSAVVVMLAITAIVMVFGSFPNIKHYFSSTRPKEFTREKDGFLFLIMTAVAIVICTPIFFARLSRLKKIVKAENTVNANVIGTSFYRDRCRIEFTYEYEEQTYSYGNSVMKNRDTEFIASHETTKVFVHPQEPHKALIAELYTVSAL